MADATLVYVYGIVRPDFDARRAPAGLDDAPVTVDAVGGVGALVSRLPQAVYDADGIEQHSGDVSWLSPRAMAHDRVLTWAQDHGGVIPMPMFSMWGSNAALADSLGKQQADFEKTFARVADADEFGLRIHRRDDVMLGAIDELDPAMRRLRNDASAASPGQRYLLERKLAEEGKKVIRAVSQRLAKEVFDDLRPLAREAVARPLVPDASKANDATMVLNGVFLVARSGLEEFRHAVARHVASLQPRGLTFDFTGPWPPYHFSK